MKETVDSPTFTILKEYTDGRLPLYHFDVYRIADSDEMLEIGYEDFFYGDGVCLVEWASLIEELIPEKACAIEELLAELENIGKDIVFSGDGVPVYSKMIESGFQSKEIRIFFADSPNNRQRAASVAALGMKKYREWLENNGLDSGTIRKNGAGSISCFDDTVMNSDDFVPEYLRKPQAEREKDAGLLEDPGLKSLRKIANGAKD